ncbi:MAG: glycerophosphodiester phosphodiesterase family protein [Alistipes sp.]|uniref:glycerophosphodiester phosphodiesterase family protein n=1 Tax=Alistipes sp. TaxID=1872444 RepID=UPI001DA6EAEA|nr:glycerophosphodiester phosphodiesterase family protein [Alistipes sp.]MBS5021325.1 glycerophosphodiester phosphodiesterase family protein [Alistipes sp.]
MKRIAIVLLALAVLAGCAGGGTQSAVPENRAEALRMQLLSGDTSAVLVVAHRGDWRYAPENSIAAIEHSIAVGVDIVELDLQLTKDSVLIVMHDATLNRTTTGKGRVADWTLDSIRTLKLKNGCGIRTKHTVPTLEEALLAARGRVLLNLDKADRYFDLVVPLLEKTGTTRQIVMKGSKPAAEVLGLYGKYLDEVIYMPVVNLDREDAPESMEAYIAELKPVAYELIYAEAKDAAMPLRMRDELRGKALIWYNTLWDTLCGGHDDDLSLEDPDAAFGYLIDTLGARIIQTDRAEHLLTYLRDRGLHR